MTDQTTSTRQRKRRPVRRLIKLLGIVFVLVIVFVALAPSLISWGIGKGAIENLISKQINGSATIDTLSVGWFSGQKIEHIRIRSDDGDADVDLSVSMDKGLLPLVFGSRDFGDVQVTGDIKGVRYEDGSTSLQKLIRTDPNAPPLDFSQYALDLTVTDLNLALHDRGNDLDLALENAAAKVTFAPTATTHIDVTADTRAGDAQGSMSIKGTAQNLLNTDGSFNRAGGSVDLTAELADVSVTLLDALLGMNNQLVAISGDTVQTASVVVKGQLDDALTSIAIDAERLSVRGDVHLTKSAIVIDPASPVIVRGQLSDALVDAFLGGDAAAQPDEPAPLFSAARLELQSIDPSSPANVQLEITSLNAPLTEAGSLDRAATSLTAYLALRNTRLLVSESAELRSIDLADFDAQLTADPLASAAHLVANGSAVINGGEATQISIDLTHDAPVQADGAIAFDVAKVTGSATLANVPTVLLAEAVRDMPINLNRDIGEVVTVEASFSSGESRDITLAVVGANLDAAIEALVHPDGSIIGRRLAVETDVHPELLSGYMKDGGIALPQHLTISATSFALPAGNADKPFSLADITDLDGRIGLSGDRIAVAGDGLAVDDVQPLEIRELGIAFSAKRLGDAVKVDGTVRANDAEILLDETISNIFDESGAIAVMQATPIGTLTMSNITPEQIVRFAPDNAALIEGVLDGPMSLTAVTKLSAGTLQGVIDIDSRGLGGKVRIGRSLRDVTLEGLELTTRLTPELSRVLQPDAEQPIELSADRAVVRIDEPMQIASRNDDGSYTVTFESISAAVESSPLTVTHVPGIAEALRLDGFTADIEATLGDAARYAVDGRAEVFTASDSVALTAATFDVVLERPAADAPMKPTANATLRDINVERLATAMSPDGPSPATFLGDRGELTLTATPTDEGFTATLQPAFPNLSGSFDLTATERNYEVTARDSTVVLKKEALERWLNAPDADGNPPAVRLTVEMDVPLEVNITRLVVPAAIASSEPLESTAVEIDLALKTRNALAISRTDPTTGNVESFRMKQWQAQITGNDLREGITAVLGGNIRTFQGEQEAGTSAIDLNVRIADLVDAESKFSAAAPTLHLDADVKDLPAWVLDAFMQDDLYVAALGERVNANVRAEAFSTSGGTLTATMNSTNGSSLNATLLGGDNGYRTAPDKPVTAEFILSKPLRDQLLSSLHPIFADVMFADEAIRLTVNDAFLPGDDNKSRLNAGIQLKVGAVEFKSSSQFLRILQFVQTADRETIPGFIGPVDGSPVAINITDGIVKYNNLVIHVGERKGEYKNRLVFTGDINLPENYVNALSAVYPISDLGRSIDELRNVPDVAQVGVKFTGPLATGPDGSSQLEMSFDIQFKPENIIREGLRPGGLLDGLLNRDKKKKDEDQQQPPDGGDGGGSGNEND